MRVDKYLKVSRLIKRRTVANEACDQEKIRINGRPAKPGAEVKPGDILEIQFGNSITKVEVTSVSEHANKADAKEMYKLIG
jgi:ribosomal 50S subunit-recycling heat shock protein